MNWLQLLRDFKDAVLPPSQPRIDAAWKKQPKDLPVPLRITDLEQAVAGINTQNNLSNEKFYQLCEIMFNMADLTKKKNLIDDETLEKINFTATNVAQIANALEHNEKDKFVKLPEDCLVNIRDTCESLQRLCVIAKPYAGLPQTQLAAEFPDTDPDTLVFSTNDILNLRNFTIQFPEIVAGRIPEQKVGVKFDNDDRYGSVIGDVCRQTNWPATLVNIGSDHMAAQGWPREQQTPKDIIKFMSVPENWRALNREWLDRKQPAETHKAETKIPTAE